MKKITGLFTSVLLISTCLWVVSCNSNSTPGKNTTAEEENLLKADTIPFITTIKKMVDFKNAVIKKFGENASLADISFDEDEFSLYIVNEKDSMHALRHSYKDGEISDVTDTMAMNSYERSLCFTPTQIPIATIPVILKNFRDSFADLSAFDSCKVIEIRGSQKLKVGESNVKEFV